MSSQPRPAERPESVSLNLEVTDPEVVEALLAVQDLRQRNELARTALRIGVLALQQARGRVDEQVLRNEGARLVEQVAKALETHQRDVAERVASSLKDYFDPESGRFPERVKRLVSRDGELEQALRRLVGAQDSELARTLAAAVGEGSALMRTLDPKAGDGVIVALNKAVEEQLRVQREHIVSQFSLDRPDSALCRLVEQVTARHGDLEKGLRERIDEVVAEFSLDSEDSALSLLVQKVSRAQEQITKEFSLDNKESALARMQGELLELIRAQAKESRDFQAEVMKVIEGMKQRRESEARTTLHGLSFESALRDALTEACRGAGDVLEETGTTPGLIKLCKTGDFVVTMGADSRASGARIVVEAKGDAGYSLKKALDELEEARKNRGAAVGVFCWARASAPAGCAPLARHGNDVVLTWDAEDPATDAYLHAGLSLARALCTKAAADREEQAADLEAIERSIREIEKQAASLDEIRTSAETIQKGADKILNRVRIAQDALRKQVSGLDDSLGDLRAGAP